MPFGFGGTRIKPDISITGQYLSYMTWDAGAGALMAALGITTADFGGDEYTGYPLFTVPLEAYCAAYEEAISTARAAQRTLARPRLLARTAAGIPGADT